jgi:hypothetical protein
MRIGSPAFHCYNRNLHRFYLLNLVDEERRRARDRELATSLLAQRRGVQEQAPSARVDGQASPAKARGSED